MAMFVHLASQSNAKLIRRNGICRQRKFYYDYPAGIFAVPLIPDYVTSHQWLRELKRFKRSPMVAVYFRLPDHELVWLGPYREEHHQLTAAQAVAAYHCSQSALGLEVIVPRAVAAKEIHAIRNLRQILGWRFFPTAKGMRPRCGCKYCTGGQYGARRLRERLGFTSSN